MGPRGRRARRRGLIVGGAIGASAARRSSGQSDDDSQPARAAADDKYAELEKLAKLKEEGILTEEEFAAQKAKLLEQ